MADQNGFGRRHIFIELADKGGHHRLRLLAAISLWEKGFVAVIGPGADEKHLNTKFASLFRQPQHICITQPVQMDILIGLNSGQGANPVAPQRGLFKIQRLCGFLHMLGIFFLYRIRPAR